MLKIIGRLIVVILAVGVGFYIRGLMPAGDPPGGMMGFGEMPPPAVVAVELKEMPLDVLDEYIASVEPVHADGLPGDRRRGALRSRGGRDDIASGSLEHRRRR